MLHKTQNAQIIVENNINFTGHLWPKPLILAIQEAEIQRTTVWSQPGQNGSWEPVSKSPSQKRVDREAEGVGPEFKP
jgi:hypothetical protein